MFRALKLFVLPVLLTAALAALAGFIKTADAQAMPGGQDCTTKIINVGGVHLRGTTLCWREYIPAGLPAPPPVDGGKGGNGCHVDCGSGGDTPPALIVQKDRTVYVTAFPVYQAGDGSYSTCADLESDQIKDGTFRGAPLSNAYYIIGVGIKCDIPWGYVLTGARVDYGGVVQPDGPYLLLGQIATAIAVGK